MIELDTNAARGNRAKSFEFIKVDARIFTTITVSIHENEDPVHATLNALEKRSSEIMNSVVRVQIEMPEEMESAFQESRVRQALVTAHHVAGIEKRVIRSRRTRLDSQDSTALSPIQALRQYAIARKMSPEREQRLVEQAEHLIQEELEGN